MCNITEAKYDYNYDDFHCAMVLLYNNTTVFERINIQLNKLKNHVISELVRIYINKSCINIAQYTENSKIFYTSWKKQFNLVTFQKKDLSTLQKQNVFKKHSSLIISIKHENS